jgi:hypothetical protein
MDEHALILCARCGPAMLILYFVGMIIAGQFPVLSPAMSAQELAAYYQHNTDQIRFGMIIAFVATALYLPFTAVISAQMRRMEGSTPILTYAQFAGGMGGLVALLLPMVLLIVAAFRPERPPEITQALHDTAWILVVIILNSYCVQYFAFARAVINDNNFSAEPIFPRWIVYVNYMTGLSFFIDVMLAFYKTGPFAWNGLVGLYVAATCWTIWFFTMSHVLVKAIRRQAQLEREEFGLQAITREQSPVPTGHAALVAERV